MFKNFSNNENQKLWDTYYNKQLTGLEGSEKDKKKTSINQYKPILLIADETINKPFSEMKINEYKQVEELAINKNRLNHLNGFLVEMVNEKQLTLDKNVLTMLVPSQYRNIIKILLD